MIITGLGTVLKSFANVMAIEATVDRIVHESAQRVVAGQIAGAPKGDKPHEGPDLAASFVLTREGMAHYAITNTARHALAMEYGNYKDTPQPYFWQPVDREAPGMITRLRTAASDFE